MKLISIQFPNFYVINTGPVLNKQSCGKGEDKWPCRPRQQSGSGRKLGKKINILNE
jgi:hypothetical protein